MKLREIYLKGYKSIDGDVGQTISFGDVTLLLGANGTGKSNLVSFFKLLNSMTIGELSKYVGKHGVNRLLYYGLKQTETLSFELQFKSDEISSYSAVLSHSYSDNIFIVSNQIRLANNDQIYFLKGSSFESELRSETSDTCKNLYNFLSNIRTYQFHDTSDTAPVKLRSYVDDVKFLHSDAGNLAPFLKMLQEYPAYKKYYDRIVRHIQRVMPQFGNFDLEPIPGSENNVRLNWKDSSGNDYLFDPGQISDGSLRFMALATLLLQPPELLPKFIILDEPELGLHPAAIAELSGLVRIAAQNTQVLVATQSTRLVDEFLPEEIVVVERDEQQRCSVFKKLDAARLEDWLARYSLSELWEKNVLGGQP